MPLSGGPSLILALGPMSWQGEHNRLNTCSPAAASCARAALVEAASAIPTITQVFIFFSSSDFHQRWTSTSAARPNWMPAGRGPAHHCYGELAILRIA